MLPDNQEYVHLTKDLLAGCESIHWQVYCSAFVFHVGGVTGFLLYVFEMNYVVRNEICLNY